MKKNVLIYRLEFSEDQQQFHLEIVRRKPANTFGWVTIMENCTDIQFKILRTYVRNKNKKGVTLTNEFLWGCVSRINSLS